MRKSILTSTFFGWLLVSTPLLYSCADDPASQDEQTTTELNFDWTTIRQASISIPATGSPASKTLVKVYNSPLYTAGSLVASGYAYPGMPFSPSLDIEDYRNELFIKTVSTTGGTKYYSYSLSGQSTKTNHQNSLQTISLPTIPTPAYSIPINFDQTILGTPTQTLTLEGDKSYYIPSGVKITSNLSPANYTGFSTLYVAGSIEISTLQFSRCNLVILKGGKVTCPSLLDLSNLSSKQVGLYIEEGASLEVGTINCSQLNGATLINKGTIISKQFNLSNDGAFYNEGSIIGSQESLAHITNSFIVHNGGYISFKYIELSTEVSITNYPKAIINTTNLYATNAMVKINNILGFITVSEVFSTQADMSNSGYIGCDTFSGYGSKSYISSGALVECNKFNLNNARITMEGGALLTAFDLSQSDYYNTSFTNNTSDLALIIVYEGPDMKDQRWSQNKFIGKIEVNYKKYDKSSYIPFGNITQYDALESPSCAQGAYFSKTQLTNIPITDWNKGKGSNSNNDNIDEVIDPNNPDVKALSFFPSADSYASIAFEDTWPMLGDYDLNDIVIDFQLIKATDANNQVVSLTLNWRLKAAGTQYKIASGVQLDRLSPSDILSLTRSASDNTSLPTLSSSPIGSTLGGLEAKQSQAVFPLFNDISEIYGSNNKMINTMTNLPIVDANIYTIKIVFRNRPKLDELTMNRINLFIVVNQDASDRREKEIHLCNYPPTDLALSIPNGEKFGLTSPNNRYKTIEGKMWGVLIPEPFYYPLEQTPITDAYNHYEGWSQSNSTKYSDWFKDNGGYINHDKVFPR